MIKPAQPSNEAIAAFWTWFCEKSAQLEPMIDNSSLESLSYLMEGSVRSLACDLGWEVGPGLRRKYQLSFTLNGDILNLQVAQDMIRRSPELVQWEFHAGRPAKKWNLTFSMHNQEKRQVNIDANHWKYSLVGFDNFSFFDIAILAPDLPSMDESAKTQAATILLQGLLGEVAFLQRIDRIEVFEKHDEPDGLSDIHSLADHLKFLVHSQK